MTVIRGLGNTMCVRRSYFCCLSVMLSNRFLLLSIKIKNQHTWSRFKIWRATNSNISGLFFLETFDYSGNYFITSDQTTASAVFDRTLAEMACFTAMLPSAVSGPRSQFQPSTFPAECPCNLYDRPS